MQFPGEAAKKWPWHSHFLEVALKVLLFEQLRQVLVVVFQTVLQAMQVLFFKRKGVLGGQTQAE